MKEFSCIKLVNSSNYYCMFNFCLVGLTDDEKLRVICAESLENLTSLLEMGVSFFQTSFFLNGEKKNGYKFEVPVSFIREMNK